VPDTLGCSVRQQFLLQPSVVPGLTSMPIAPSECLSILRCYPPACQPVGELLPAANGFSGALVWQVPTATGPLCLRRWPTVGPTAERLRFIHAVMAFTFQQGATFIPEIRFTNDQTTFVAASDHLWELTTWLPGTADFLANPTSARLTAALRTLAQWHLAAGIYPLTVPTFGPSPGLAARARDVEKLRVGGVQELVHAVQCAEHSRTSLANQVVRILPSALTTVASSLNTAATLAVAWQPVLRDIWHEHVLFTGDIVTGLIDFGALRIDTVATDLARLIGSLVGNDYARWQVALDAYEAIRPLANEERRLIQAFHRTGVLLSAVQWLEWLYVERRVFPEPNRAEARATVVFRDCLAVFGESAGLSL